MKVRLLFISLLLYSAIAAQGSATIEYKQYNNTGMPNYLYCTLSIDGPTSVYLPKYTTQVYDNPAEAMRGRSKYAAKKTVDTGFIKIDHNKKEVLSFEYIGPHIMLVKDDYPVLGWVITEETKQLGGYTCIKASASYRGTDWIVWFTPDIPLPYGPWKLHGLPGLIVEATETTDTYHMKLDKIEYIRDPVFDKDFEELVATKNIKPLSRKDFLKEEDEYHENVSKQFSQPGAAPMPKFRRTGYELKYEWEE